MLPPPELPPPISVYTVPFEPFDSIFPLLSTLLEYITNNPPVPFSPVPSCAFPKSFCPPIPPGFPAPPPANLVAHDELAL